MEKRERVNKIATAWEEKKTEYWVVTDFSGYNKDFDTEEAAIKAQEFMDALDWRKTILVETGNISVELITANFKYPLQEVYPSVYTSMLGYNYPFDDVDIPQGTGEVKFIRVRTFSEYDDEVLGFIPVEGDIKEQLINFLKD